MSVSRLPPTHPIADLNTLDLHPHLEYPPLLLIQAHVSVTSPSSLSTSLRTHENLVSPVPVNSAWIRNSPFVGARKSRIWIRIRARGRRGMWLLVVSVSTGRSSGMVWERVELIVFCGGFDLCLFLCLVLIERDSPRDQLVVTCFILVVLGLLLTSVIRNR
jgi:hypothetical protein